MVDIFSVSFIQQLFSRFTTQCAPEEEEKPEQLLPELTIQGVADYIKSKKCESEKYSLNLLKSIY